LLSATPVLRWTPVAGVAGYRVIVRGGGSAWSEDVQSSIEISYPDLAPQLKPGIDYKLIVETGDRSSYEPGFDLGFSILDPKDRKRVLQEEKQIENLSLPDEPTQFLIAHLYASYGLRAEAIEKLEAVSQKFKAAAVAALLGDLYASTGLIRQSEASYLNAVELAKNENDEIGSMLAHLALGRIYQQELGSANAAITHFDSALALANRLGDNLTAAEAGEKLAELRKTGTR
jgi:tetratricopeptide (TPR) repeat protein